MSREDSDGSTIVLHRAVPNTYDTTVARIIADILSLMLTLYAMNSIEVSFVSCDNNDIPVVDRVLVFLLFSHLVVCFSTISTLVQL